MLDKDPTKKPWDSLWYHARIATMTLREGPYGLLEDGAIGVVGERIVWIGKTSAVPQEQYENCSLQTDCNGCLITPGLIDCHTHLIYGGERIDEFEMRLNGASYAEISKSGGGIAATVKATRASSENALFGSAMQRLLPFLNEGVTTIEVKSGYGLDLDNELKILRVADRIAEQKSVDISKTYLGAHAVPHEFEGQSDNYIDYICSEVLPVVAVSKLADSVDAFCETIAFSEKQVRQVFTCAKEYGLPIKLHAEQLSDQKGAVMAAEMGALSVDHIEYLSETDVRLLKRNGTVAVLLPGAFYFLGETKLPPISALREQGVPIAIASDANPGSSPVSSLLLMLNMACTLFKLTPEESLAGVTRNAAKALGLENEVGTLEVGKVANLVLWSVKKPAELSYRIGYNPCQTVMYRGVIR